MPLKADPRIPIFHMVFHGELRSFPNNLPVREGSEGAKEDLGLRAFRFEPANLGVEVPLNSPNPTNNQFNFIRSTQHP
jgi:hypothetical protein